MAFGQGYEHMELMSLHHQKLLTSCVFGSYPDSYPLILNPLRSACIVMDSYLLPYELLRLFSLKCLLLFLQPVHRREFMVLSGQLRPGEMKIMAYHVQSGMAEYLLEREDIATIQ